MKKSIKSSKGAALAVLIIIFAVVAIVGTTVLTISLSQTKLSVASEDVTAAYYYARSAVEIVSSNIEDKFGDLKTKEANITAYIDAAKGADGNIDDTEYAELDSLISALAEAQAKFDALKLIPESTSETCRVDIDGLLPDALVSVSINLVPKGEAQVIELSSTVTYEGCTSSARAQIGTFTDDSIEVPIQTKVEFDIGDLGDDALFAWGDVQIQGANITMNDFGTQKAMISAQGGIADKQGEPISAGYVNSTLVIRAMPILVPPTTLDYSTTLLSGEKKVGDYGTEDYYKSGYYGSLDGTITWTVDTSQDDVVLIFDSINSPHVDITVSGPHNLYIYIREPYDVGKSTTRRTLLNIPNPTTIKSSDGKPHTYFIVYNDVIQKKQAELGTTLLPAEEALKISRDTAILDFVNLTQKSSPVLAYFYAPGCQVNIENKSDIDGAIYGSNINIQGNKTFNFVPFDFNSMIDSAGEDIDGVIVTGTALFPYKKSYYDRIWVR